MGGKYAMKGVYEFSYFKLPVIENYFRIKKVKAKISYIDILFERKESIKDIRINRIISRDIIKKSILKKKVPIYVLIVLDSTLKSMNIALTDLFTKEKKNVLFISKRCAIVSMRASDRVDIEIPLRDNDKEIRYFYYKDFIDTKNW